MTAVDRMIAVAVRKIADFAHRIEVVDHMIAEADRRIDGVVRIVAAVGHKAVVGRV